MLLHRRLSKQFDMAALLEHYRILDELAYEASVNDWDGPGTYPVASSTLALARGMLAAMGVDEGPTSINVDPDGELTFDWLAGDDHLAVSLSPAGRLSYIHRAGGARSRDTMQLVDGVLPDKLKELIPRGRT